MKRTIVFFCVLTACAETPPSSVYVPVEVSVPVAVACTKPDIKSYPDLMLALPSDASLSIFTKACSAQTLLDKSHIDELQAVLQSCSETFNKE